MPPLELKSLCEELRQRTCKCQQISRHKRKYSSLDRKSKRAKIDNIDENFDESSKFSNFDATCSSTSDGIFKRSGDATQSKGKYGSQSPGKRQGLRSGDKSEGITTLIENNSAQTKGSVARVDSTRLELSNKSVVHSSKVKGDCYCIPDSAYDLLSKCLKLDPLQRISASDALNHQFLTS